MAELKGQTIRVGVIGCGFFATNHLNAWNDLKAKGVHLVAVCDLDEQRAKSAAETYGTAHWFTDAGRMIAECDLDLVDIVTQVGTHRALAEMALDAVPGVIVQKPFAPTLEDCRAIVARAEQRKAFLAVHENFRFQLPLRKARDIIDQGLIGVPNWARISFRTGYDIYTGQPYLREEERFVVTDLGVHVLDVARYYLGEVETVSAELQHRNTDIKGEDTATMLLRHTSGAVSVVECTYGARREPDPFPQTIVELEGTEGSVIVNAGYRIDVTGRDSDKSIHAEAEVLPWAEKPWHVVQESVLATCEHIAERFRDGQPADVSGLDNLKTYALVEATYQSAKEKRAVRPDV